MQNRASRMREALTSRFAPSFLEITDDSGLHVGHSGARPEGETHYGVVMVSPAFSGQSRVARSRAVHEALAGEFATGLHALVLTLRAPEETR